MKQSTEVAASSEFKHCSCYVPHVDFATLKREERFIVDFGAGRRDRSETFSSCNACERQAKRAGVSAGVLDGVPVRMPVPVRVGPAGLSMAAPLSICDRPRMRPEQMRVYQVVAELGRLVDQILSEPIPKRARYVAGHIRRSMESAGLNLNEGLTEFAPKVKANAFGTSRKELGELKKGLSRFDDMKGRPTVLLRKGCELVDGAIGMLTVMIKQQEEREG